MYRKIGIIGHFGADTNSCDGQTVKTKNLADLLEKDKKIEITKVDTYFFKTNKVKLFLDTVKCMFACEHIFLMVSEKGMQFYLPFLFYLNKITRKNIYHYIIGSELLALVDRKPGLVKYLNALAANWFEYESVTQYLQQKGVKNVSTLVNFKMITPVPTARRYEDEQGVFRFCTFSRVMEEKGITEAINVISAINEQAGKMIVALDIYGPIDKGYEVQFAQLMNKQFNGIAYKGVVDSNGSVAVLKQDFALLFPTKWPGEGVAGTIIDSFAAGIPIIATDWNANGELIKNKQQGILYPNNEITDLKEAICWAIEHPEEMNQMRLISREEFVKYLPETIMKFIFGEMERREVL